MVTFDFSTASDEQYDNLVSELKKNKNIRIVVNNVGVSYDYPVYYHELERKKINDLINVNVKSAAFLTHGLLPELISNAKGNSKRSLIVNISSATSLIPTPLLAGYGGAKSFVNTWSEALNAEYAHKKVDVVTLTPWFVSTKMSKMKPSLLAPTAKAYVRETLNTLSYAPLHAGFLLHIFQSAVFSIIPTPLAKLYVKFLHDPIRIRGHKKYNVTNYAF